MHETGETVETGDGDRKGAEFKKARQSNNSTHDFTRRSPSDMSPAASQLFVISSHPHPAVWPHFSASNTLVQSSVVVPPPPLQWTIVVVGGGAWRA